MRAVSLGAVVLLSVCVAVAIGDETASLSVTNLTSHVVVILVDGKSLPAVAPGTQGTYQSSGPATVSVKVSYVPGQGVEGSAQRTFHLSPYHPATGSGGTVYWACTVGGTITSPASGGTIIWRVTADTLTVR